MDRDISEIKRLIERMQTNMDRLVNQTDQVEKELLLIRTALDRMNEREDIRDKKAEDATKW